VEDQQAGGEQVLQQGPHERRPVPGRRDLGLEQPDHRLGRAAVGQPALQGVAHDVGEPRGGRPASRVEQPHPPQPRTRLVVTAALVQDDGEVGHHLDGLGRLPEHRGEASLRERPVAGHHRGLAPQVQPVRRVRRLRQHQPGDVLGPRDVAAGQGRGGEHLEGHDARLEPHGGQRGLLRLLRALGQAQQRPGPGDVAVGQVRLRSDRGVGGLQRLGVAVQVPQTGGARDEQSVVVRRVGQPPPQHSERLVVAAQLLQRARLRADVPRASHAARVGIGGRPVAVFAKPQVLAALERRARFMSVSTTAARNAWVCGASHSGRRTSSARPDTPSCATSPTTPPAESHSS